MKRISAIILVLVLATFAVGCDKTPSAGTATTTITTTAPMTTTVTKSADTTTTTVTTAAAETTTTTAATRRSTTTEKPKSTTKTVTTKVTTAATTVTTTVRTTVTTTKRTTTATAADTASYGQQMLTLINRERTVKGLAPLTFRSDLQALADTRTAEIKQSFSHTRPNGTSCFTVFEDAGLQFAMLGENIAYGQRSVEEVMEAWMNSEGHRANILNPQFNGVAVGFDDYNWVQLFVRE